MACVNLCDWLFCEGCYVFCYLVVGFFKVFGSDVVGVVCECGVFVCGF